jgi:peptidoglycan/xylan/chitin deacetylase (PgdA/CDA1 family)
MIMQHGDRNTELLTRKIKFSLKRGIEKATNYRICYHVPPWSTEKFILTFDDGPVPSTKYILDLLDKYKLKAIFFMIGENIMKSPEIAQDVFRRGHLVGSHGLFHNTMKSLSLRNFLDQIRKSFQIIYETVGYKSTFFRPPLGEIRPVQTISLVQKGITVFFWSCSVYEYGEIRFINPRISVDNYKPNNKRMIVLLHDYLPLNVIEFAISHFMDY